MRPGSRGGVPGAPLRAPAAVPPGTASRLATGMRPGTGSTAGGVALNTNVQVEDRPMTRQGLGGLKTGMAGGRQRQVQDKTYFLGVLRSKIQELNSEIGRLKRDVDTTTEDQSSYVSYEKRAEGLASEIKDLHAELGDYNTLVDKMNTDESIADIQMDYEELKAKNDRESQALDHVFEQKQQREQVIKQLEIELQQERGLTETLVADMNTKMRQQYYQLKEKNEHMLKTLDTDQQELDRLTMKRKELEEELAMSPVKQEAVRLYEQLQELEEKRDQLLAEQQAQGSPQEERERLLKQVKENNQEIAAIERQTHDIEERITQLQEEIQQLDMDIDENQAYGERNQKYRELKKREEGMDEFLNTYDDSRRNEQEKMGTYEQNIVLLLEHMSRNLARFTHLPTSSELSTMKEDLAFKENEMKKSENTASGLAHESQKLQDDLAKVEQLEAKITGELETLKEKTSKMEEELVIYGDLERLKMEAEAKKKKLGEDKVILHKRRETFRKVMQQMSSQYEALKARLNDNETYTQLGNLERKWQHVEQNNFTMKEFIAAKTMESDFKPLAKKVSTMVNEYNKYLQENTGKTTY